VHSSADRDRPVRDDLLRSYPFETCVCCKWEPKGELFLGWLSIIILSVTGVLLTIARIPSWEVLYATRFGTLLSSKIVLFLIMAAAAFVVTVVIGPKKKKSKERWVDDISKGKL
jgi:hypothetical protein